MNEIIIAFATFFVASFAIVLTLGVGCAILFQKVIHPNIRELVVQKNRMSLADIFETAEFIVTIECNLYEKYFDANTTAGMQSLSNSEFLNIYNDLAMKCLKAFSPSFWAAAEVYITREELQTYVTQRVFNYLHSKINVEEPSEEEDEG